MILDEPAHRLSWRDTPINRLTREQMIECIEGAYRNIDALRHERDTWLDRYHAADRALTATIKDCEQMLRERVS